MKADGGYGMTYYEKAGEKRERGQRYLYFENKGSVQGGAFAGDR